MHYCSTVNGFYIFEELHFYGFITTNVLQRKVAKIDYSFIVVNQKQHFHCSLLFNVKSGLIRIQKLVLIHTPADTFGQVKLLCCNTEIFSSFLF